MLQQKPTPITDQTKDDSRKLFVPRYLDEYGLEPAEFRIFARVSRRGECTESARNMALGCKLGVRTVRLALRLLAIAGLIEETSIPGRCTVRQCTSRERWVSPERLDELRVSIKSRWLKCTPAPGDTPAPSAALSPSAAHPLPPVQPTHAPSAAKGISHEGSPNKGNNTAAERPADPLYTLFCEAYQKKYTVDVLIDYRPSSGDFVQLADLKKRQNGSLESLWARAVGNYFRTPQASHSLADLCKRFATFQKSSLTQYGKPIPERAGRASVSSAMTGFAESRPQSKSSLTERVKQRLGSETEMIDRISEVALDPEDPRVVLVGVREKLTSQELGIVEGLVREIEPGVCDIEQLVVRGSAHSPQIAEIEKATATAI